MRVEYNEEVRGDVGLWDDNDGRYRTGKGSVSLLMSHQKDILKVKAISFS